MGAAISVLMPDVLISGFMAGAGFLVLTTQVTKFFGLEDHVSKSLPFPKHLMVKTFVIRFIFSFLFGNIRETFNELSKLQ
jgi:MFS superfamily sulfate permease-like transporter